VHVVCNSPDTFFKENEKTINREENRRDSILSFEELKDSNMDLLNLIMSKDDAVSEETR
jgi:hypothetical protein